MSVIVSTNARLIVAGIDFSDHVKKVTVNSGQETRDVSAMGNTQRIFRAGIGTASITAELYNDTAASSIEPTLRALISVTSTGFSVSARKVNSATTTVNPDYRMEAVIDGEINLLDESHGEVGMVSVTFKPYSAFSVSTSAS